MNTETRKMILASMLAASAIEMFTQPKLKPKLKPIGSAKTRERRRLRKKRK